MPSTAWGLWGSCWVVSIIPRLEGWPFRHVCCEYSPTKSGIVRCRVIGDWFDLASTSLCRALINRSLLEMNGERRKKILLSFNSNNQQYLIITIHVYLYNIDWHWVWYKKILHKLEKHCTSRRRVQYFSSIMGYKHNGRIKGTFRDHSRDNALNFHQIQDFCI